ncbi:hypothetical protein ACVI55_003574 [Sinorhizobium medicae]
MAMSRARSCVFPSEALAERVELADVAEVFLDQVALAGVHGALDELNDGTGHAVGDVAKDHAEARGRFALALAGVDDDQTFFVRLRGHDLVTGGLLLRHLQGMTRFVLFGSRFAGIRDFLAHVVLPIDFRPEGGQ